MACGEQAPSIRRANNGELPERHEIGVGAFGGSCGSGYGEAHGICFAGGYRRLEPDGESLARGWQENQWTIGGIRLDGWRHLGQVVERHVRH